MLKLNTRPPAPRWIDLLPGVRLQVRPIAVVDHLRARNDAAQVYRDNPTPEGEPRNPEAGALAAVTLVKSFARAAIVDWEGIGDGDGEPIEVTPEAIDQLLDLLPAYEAFDAKVVVPALNGTD